MTTPAAPGHAAARGGLSRTEVRARQEAEGFNELPRPGRRSTLRIVGEVLREPMLALLLGAGVVYLGLGNLQDAIILLAFASLSVVITVVQESRTEHVLEALSNLTSPRALVIRDGQRVRIAGRDVVRGDLVVLSEGDRVPADALLLECHELQADESLLTGESVPVRKAAAEAGARPGALRPGGDGLPAVFSGSLVVRGTGIAEVTAIGARSEIGRIGQSLGSVETETPRLHRETRRLVRIFGLAGLVVSTLAVLLYGFLRGGWLDALLGGIALGMSMLPEEFPVVLTVFMAMGAWRISRARVLTRRAAAIETLGSATVLCSDKTGTLTQNRMSIAELRVPGAGAFRPDRGGTLPAAFRDLVQYGLLASEANPFDPMERAFHDLGDAPGEAWSVAHTWGIEPGLLAMSQAWRAEDAQGELVVATKGAPEAIVALCRLAPTEAAAVRDAVDAMAADGLRILGVARAAMPDRPRPGDREALAHRFLGLVGLADPLRPGVPEAVGECRTAGIRVVMITGDYPATARAMARQAGLDAAEVVTGPELERMSDAELGRRVRTATVFARILPEQKLRIVAALKAAGEVVAMTGDGVNDAPSLKAAHIGIAMGGRGTDVAREASAMVLLDDDFGSIVTTIRLGRRIYDNLRKAMGFILAVHVPIAGMALLPLLLGLPVLFGPVHIAFLEMVIDPVCSLVFEAERAERDVMQRPPRRPDAPLFGMGLIAWSLVQGAVALALVALIYLGASGRGMPEDEVRALSFFSLVLAIVSLILANRSFSASPVAAFRRPSPALVLVLLGVAAVLAGSLLWPVASALFRFGPLHGPDIAVTAGAGAAVLVLLNVLKLVVRRVPGSSPLHPG